MTLFLCMHAWTCSEFVNGKKLQALVAAWKAACKVNGATVKIPSQFKFLINPITLQGPCMPSLVLQV